MLEAELADWLAAEDEAALDCAAEDAADEDAALEAAEDAAEADEDAALAEPLPELDAAEDEHPAATASASAHTDANTTNLTKRMDFIMDSFPLRWAYGTTPLPQDQLCLESVNGASPLHKDRFPPFA